MVLQYSGVEVKYAIGSAPFGGVRKLGVGIRSDPDRRGLSQPLRRPLQLSFLTSAIGNPAFRP